MNDSGSYYFNCSRSPCEQQDTLGDPNQEAEHRGGESDGTYGNASRQVPTGTPDAHSKLGLGGQIFPRGGPLA